MLFLLLKTIRPFYPKARQKERENVLFFVPVWRLVPLPHNRAAALCASTLLPNLTLDVANKFAVCATSRGSVLSLQKPNGCKKRSFFVPVFGSYPCRTLVRRHYMPRHFFSGSPQKNRLCGVFYGILVIFCISAFYYIISHV